MASFSSLYLLVVAYLLHPTYSFWRLPCRIPIVVERADSVISPSGPSGHLNAIMSGSSFAFTMDYAQTHYSTCSSCSVKGDFLNHWIPALYYQYSNASFEKVNQIGSTTVCYLQRIGTNETLKAFPEGFRMVAADPRKRSATTDFASQVISYACLNKSALATPETSGFPNANCSDGLRAQVFFPSSWNDIDLDSADHKSHMSYSAGSYDYGECPLSHPVHLVSIFYEIIWSVNEFVDMWYGSTQPFLWIKGDSTGLGLHGDFFNGRNVDLLQSAADQCASDSGNVEDCPVFSLTPDNVAEQCKLSTFVDEPVIGVLDKFSGCKFVQLGPNEAVPGYCCGQGSSSTTSSSAETGSTEIVYLSSSETADTISSSLSTSQVSVASYGTSTAITVSVTSIVLVISTFSATKTSSTYGPHTSNAAGDMQRSRAKRHIQLQGQHLYEDDARWREH